MNELEKKQKEMWRLREEIRELEDKERREKEWPVWKEREGTYWKFRNSYSCPESDADRWWIYRRIKNVTPDGYMDTIDVQIDVNGRLDVRETKRNLWTCGMGWQPSTPEEWKEAAMMAQGIMRKLG